MGCGASRPQAEPGATATVTLAPAEQQSSPSAASKQPDRPVSPNPPEPPGGPKQPDQPDQQPSPPPQQPEPEAQVEDAPEPAATPRASVGTPEPVLLVKRPSSACETRAEEAREPAAPAPPPSPPPPSPPPPPPGIRVHTWVGGSADGSMVFPELDDPDFCIPALNDKAPLAICISGGGFRATTLGLGWLRGLHHLGLLGRAKYLVTCSGSAWLGAALCFQTAAGVGEFLGPYLPPEECGLEALGRVGDKRRSYAAAVADAAPLYDYVKDQIREVADEVTDQEEWKEARSWSRAMASAFLEPFGLGDTDGSTVTATGTKGSVHLSVSQRAGEAGRGTVYTADPHQLPFPIIVQAVLLPKDRALFYPYEWTPLYSGCPVACGHTEPKLGPGWVEAVGANAQLVEKPDRLPPADEGGAATVRVAPRGPASLGEAIGVSSAYNSYKWALGASAAGRELHKLLGFNTAEYFDQQDWASSNVALTDGGATDYHAIHPALRRRVPNIIALSATRTEIGDFEKFALHMKELALLFGCWPGNPDDTKGLPLDELNARHQVFPSEGFEELHSVLQLQVAAGEPPVHVGEYEVLGNAALGVPGGWKVRVLWVVNDRQAAWEAALPEDTRAKLEGDREGRIAGLLEDMNPLDAVTFREFPHVSTFAMNYTPELVNLMANHAAWMLVERRRVVESMLGAAARPGAGAIMVADVESDDDAGY